MNKVAIAIVLAAAIIAAALYLRPTPNRYRYEATDTELRRFDTATGEARACPKERACYTYDWE